MNCACALQSNGFTIFVSGDHDSSNADWRIMGSSFFFAERVIVSTQLSIPKLLDQQQPKLGRQMQRANKLLVNCCLNCCWFNSVSEKSVE